MAIKLKDTASLAVKFKTRAGAAQGDYKSGVEGAGADWQARTMASKDSYAQGVQAAIARDAFSKGVNDSGAARYQKRASELGPGRYQAGVNMAQDDWARGVAPYLDAIRNIDLPPRGPRRSPQNQQRSQAVSIRLAQIKEGK